MARLLKDSEELKNTYVDERVKILLPLFEALAPFKITQRKKGVGDIPGWEKLAAQEARLLKINYLTSCTWKYECQNQNYV